MSHDAQQSVLDESLRLAVCTANTDDVLRFLHAGADPNAWGNESSNALTLAVQRENLPMAALLIAHGADVNAQYTPGHSLPPLILAVLYDARGQQLNRTRFLLQQGADASRTFVFWGETIDIRGFLALYAKACDAAERAQLQRIGKLLNLHQAQPLVPAYIHTQLQKRAHKKDFKL